MKGARSLDQQEIRRIVRELEGPRDRALFLLMLYTGARISEALALNVAHVLRPGPELTIRKQIVFEKRNTKGRRTSRAVDVHPELAGALAVLLTNKKRKRGIATDQASLFPFRTEGPLFLARGNQRRLTRTAAWRRLHAAFTAAGFEQRVSPHSTRKTFAQRLHEGGTKLSVIQEVMGHADIRDTRDYIVVPEEECTRAVMSLPPIEDDDAAPTEEN